MKFGKVAAECIRQIDFSLPPDAEGTTGLLQRQDQSASPLSFYLGCTGWSMKAWVGKVYPKGAKSKDFLRAYTQQFNCIELNTTHYRIPDTETVDRWRTESADDFHFCPKIPQSISHRGDLGVDGPQLALFCERIRGLDDKLGSCFLQLPPSFGVTKRDRLLRFADRWPGDLPLAVELRHASWFNDPAAAESLFSELEERGLGTVITDVAGRRDVLHMRLTNTTAMLRFVGNGLHSTDYQRTDAWIERLLQWAGAGLKKVYFFAHEPDNVQAPELAEYIFNSLKTNRAVAIRGPELLRSDNNPQMSLF